MRLVGQILMLRKKHDVPKELLMAEPFRLLEFDSDRYNSINRQNSIVIAFTKTVLSLTLKDFISFSNDCVLRVKGGPYGG